MKNIKACLSRNTDDWKTPKELYDLIIKKGYIDTFKYKSEIDQFTISYENEKLFINPPFSKLNKVADYIIEQLNYGNKILLLMPARTDTKYFKKLLEKKPLIFFIEGRLHYNEAKSAPFPSIMLAFGYSWIFNQWINGDMKKLKYWIKQL